MNTEAFYEKIISNTRYIVAVAIAALFLCAAAVYNNYNQDTKISCGVVDPSIDSSLVNNIGMLLLGKNAQPAISPWNT